MSVPLLWVNAKAQLLFPASSCDGRSCSHWRRKCAPAAPGVATPGAACWGRWDRWARVRRRSLRTHGAACPLPRSRPCWCPSRSPARLVCAAGIPVRGSGALCTRRQARCQARVRRGSGAGPPPAAACLLAVSAAGSVEQKFFILIKSNLPAFPRSVLLALY